MKKLLFLAIAILMGTMASLAKEKEKNDSTYIEVEELPTFKGGVTKYSEWLSSSIKYPKAAQAAGAEGRAIVQFVVNKNGTISDVKIMKSTGNEELDNEAMRVVSASPKWKPGKINGKTVRTKMMQPIMFRLPKTK